MACIRAVALVILVLISNSLADNGPKPEKLTLSFAGKARTYYVFAPNSAGTSAPMLLLLHGSGHNGMSLIDPWKDIANKEGIILVAPDSSDPSHWDQAADGPDFIHAVVDAAKSKYSVDPRRVYLFGHSAGAVYALYLSVVQSEYFAATAIHAGTLLPADLGIIATATRKIPIAVWWDQRPLLFAHGSAGDPGRVQRPRLLRATYRNPSARSQLLLHSGKDQSGNLGVPENDLAAERSRLSRIPEVDGYFQIPLRAATSPHTLTPRLPAAQIQWETP